MIQSSDLLNKAPNGTVPVWMVHLLFLEKRSEWSWTKNPVTFTSTRSCEMSLFLATSERLMDFSWGALIFMSEMHSKGWSTFPGCEKFFFFFKIPQPFSTVLQRYMAALLQR